jgi:hypothetical protein
MLTIRLSAPNRTDDAMGELSFGLCDLINSEKIGAASLTEGTGSQGNKGDPITLGVIAITLIKSGAAVAMFNVLKAYFQNRATIDIELTNAAGDVLKLNASNLAGQPKDVVDKIRGLLETR